MAVARNRVLSLYKAILRESKQVPSYNFREYFIRRTRDAFRENKNLTDTIAIQQQLEKAVENLNIIKRQAMIGNMYRTDKLVIEKGR